MNRKAQSLKQQLKQSAPPLSFAAFQFPAFLIDKGKIKKKSRLRIPLGRLFLCRWWGSNPHVLLAQGILSFGEGFPFGVIWCPTLKRKSNSTSNEFLINLRFFVTFPLGSDFSIWKAKKEIGGMFRRDAEPVIQDCAHRLFSFFGKYFKPVQFRGRLICIQNEATKTGCTPRQ